MDLIRLSIRVSHLITNGPRLLYLPITNYTYLKDKHYYSVKTFDYHHYQRVVTINMSIFIDFIIYNAYKMVFFLKLIF